ncbi:hypothetical protein OAS41_00030 [Candidatus Marinimicrobia bacterium]|nr:hypothetical protein [Candidatus Neomarinimicrobiota bacterium]
MIKPIIENGYVNFSNLLDFLKKNSKNCFKYSFYISLIFLVYFFVKTPNYSSSLSFYTNYKDFNQYPSLSPFLGNLAGIDEPGLSFSISEYLESDRFLDHIVNQNYLIDSKNISLVEYWGIYYNDYITINPISFLKKINRNIMFPKILSEDERRLAFAKEVLKSKISLSENRRSGLNTVTITTKKYPDLSNQINNEVYRSVLEYTNQINNIKAREKIEFIEKRLNEVRLNLNNSEDKMLKFMIENKNFETSPKLVLEKTRIQRKIVSNNQIYLSLLDQYEIAKIDEKDNTHSLFYLDKAVLNSYKDGFSLIDGLFLTFILSYILSVVFHMYANRNSLFDFE